MKKLAAFDLEIAINPAKIAFEQISPVVGEKIEIFLGEDTWREGTYNDVVSTTEKEYDTDGLFWRPLDTSDWKRFRPLGITCAAIATPQGIWTYAARDENGFTERMDRAQAQFLYNNLRMLVRFDYKIITWNGLGFDFDILGEECDGSRICANLATSKDHVDMMFHFFCSKGFAVGLDAVSKGLGLPGKPEGVSGVKAPEMWMNGQQEEVIAYVESDAIQTLEVFQRAQGISGITIPWTARSGRPNKWHTPKWLSVPEAMMLPEPYNDWMDNPWKRSKFHIWTEKKKPLQLFDPTGIIQHDPDEGNEEY